MNRLPLKQFVPPGHHYHFAQGYFDSATPKNFHDHDFYEIFWVEEGSGRHHINHRKRPLRKGMMVFVRDSDIHALSADEGSNMRIGNLAFSRRHWDELMKRYFPAEADPMLQPHTRREFSPGHDAFLSLRRQAQRLAGQSHSRAQLDLFLLELFLLWRHTPADNPPRDIPDWLNDACREIKQPRHLEAGTSAFYRLAGRSPDHVARACRNLLGRSPTEVVNEARIDHAALLLSMSDETILDIAADCGLPNLAHFYKLFALRFGTTPRRYRLQARAITGRDKA